MDDVEIIEFDKDTKFSEIEENIENTDFVIHLAGVNRPKELERVL